MSRRERIAGFGAAVALVVIGAGSGTLLGGEVGPVVAIVLIGLGLVLAVSLVFLEVGLSEDQERARERIARAPRPPDRRRRPRLQRLRGHRRRLR